ncbi:hypothetical protein BHE74_00047779 [Ensete ventricosum]|nr:hypothetical protein BHE74_00047779 [Ensete ventricosum]
MSEIDYLGRSYIPEISDLDGEDEEGQTSSSLAVSTRWIVAAMLLQSQPKISQLLRSFSQRTWKKIFYLLCCPLVAKRVGRLRS